jgi:hypothetical protein
MPSIKLPLLSVLASGHIRVRAPQQRFAPWSTPLILKVAQLATVDACALFG